MRSIRSDPILKLGKKFVEELGLGQSTDTLSRWMAHDLALQLDELEKSEGEDRTVRSEIIKNSILALWKHRSELPKGKRPFESLEPILNALESLDPENDVPRYFRSARSSTRNDEELDETKNWLDLAEGLDYTAKMLISYCLVSAAGSAIDKSKTWVDLAEAAGIGSPERDIVRFLSNNKRLLEGEDLASKEKELLSNRLAKLEWFIEMSAGLADDLRKQLNSASIKNGKN